MRNPRHIFLVAVSGFVQSQTVTIRVAGDEWFMDSPTTCPVPPTFELETSVHVEVLHKSDRTILAVISIRARSPAIPGSTWWSCGTDYSARSFKKAGSTRSLPFLPIRSCTTPASCRRAAVPELVAGTRVRAGTTSMAIRTSFENDVPVLSQGSSGRSREPAQFQIALSLQNSSPHNVAGVYAASGVLHPAGRTFLRNVYSRKAGSDNSGMSVST